MLPIEIEVTASDPDMSGGFGWNLNLARAARLPVDADSSRPASLHIKKFRTSQSLEESLQELNITTRQPHGASQLS